MAAFNNGIISSISQRPTTITIVSYLLGLRWILLLTILREIAHSWYWYSRRVKVTINTMLSWIFSPCTVLQISQASFPYNFLIKCIPSLYLLVAKKMTACALVIYKEHYGHKEIKIVVTSFYFWVYQSHVGGSPLQIPVRWD